MATPKPDYIDDGGSTGGSSGATKSFEEMQADGSILRYDPDQLRWVVVRAYSLENDPRLRKVTRGDGSIVWADTNTGNVAYVERAYDPANDPRAKAQSAAPTVRTFADGTERQWNPETREWEEVARKESSSAAASQQLKKIGNQYFNYNPKTGELTPAEGPSGGAVGSGGSGQNAYNSLTAAQQAQMHRDALWRKVSTGELSPQQAISNFDEWWKVNVEAPKNRMDYGRDMAATTERAWSSALPYYAPDGTTDALNRAIGQIGQKNPQPVALPTGKFPYDPNNLAHRAAAEALAGIDPTAAAIMGRSLSAEYAKGLTIPGPNVIQGGAQQPATQPATPALPGFTAPGPTPPTGPQFVVPIIDSVAVEPNGSPMDPNAPRFVAPRSRMM